VSPSGTNVVWHRSGHESTDGGQYGNWLTNPLAAAQEALEWGHKRMRGEVALRTTIIDTEAALKY